ncbi:ABC transporter permease [Aliifodinibius sp. S!AR15-10]|uniref:FtsX-like permease family protein n=1 Tax=Aliifodinibius sp. S!AR15-10 TaxID=2950437 RepID=UPI00286448EB|nr:FtsX-like permease family protein [Aliifodinibius sp. S!AR15-10]MDR8393446.1 ABC transporter permease [Aliifodinibius sp. S!AR15-10]
MIKNYIKIAWRNLIRDKTYSIINTIGLTMGITCGLIIAIYILHEWSYDRFVPNSERIYRVVQEQNQASDLYQVASTPAPLAEKLRTDYPDVREVTAFSRIFSKRLFQYQDNSFEEGYGYHVDSSFFKLFDFPVLNGSLQSFFSSTQTILLTKKMAQKYFGEGDPVGKVINIDRRQDFVVAAVVENPPANSHLNFNFLLPMANLHAHRDFSNWGNNWMYTYILLGETVNPNSFEQKIGGLLSDNIGSPEWQPRLYLQPLTDIHLYSNFDFNTDFADTGNPHSIYLFGAIGLIIILISCINFVNLSTARSFQRNKEIGVRKVMGASRTQLIWQLAGESMLFAFISTALALAVAQVCMPYFAGLSGIPLSLDLLKPEHLVILLLAFMFTIGLLAGIYPALYLSALNTKRILKGPSTNEGLRKGHLPLRKILVVCQFALSVILITGAIIIRQQMHYILNRDLGFDQEHIVYSPLKGDLADNGIYESLKTALLHQSSVLEVTRSNGLPIHHEGSYSGVEWEGMAAGHQDFLMNYLEVEESFVETYGLQMLAGRNFAPRNPNDTSSYYLINETASKIMQMDNPVGKRFEDGNIIGVIKDFNFKSAFSPVEPMMLRNSPEMLKRFISIRIAPGNFKETLATIGRAFNETNPAYPFIYHFLDESIEALYNQQLRAGKLIDLFAALAVLISCLGLFGLSVFTAGRRTKEIGIRKALGATVADIVTLLNKDFLILVLLGFLIAIPIAWYAMNQWLADFAYRIEIGPEVFVIAGSAALLIALATVSWQSVKAALMNPVNSLRSE